MTDIFKEGDRAFLNRPGFHSEASVGWDITVSKESYGIHANCSFRVRDCGESVSIQLDLHDEEWFQNSVAKLNHIASQAIRARNTLFAARKAFVKAKAKEKTK